MFYTLAVLNKVSKQHYNNFKYNLTLFPILSGSVINSVTAGQTLFTILNFVQAGKSAFTKTATTKDGFIKQIAKQAKGDISFLQKYAIIYSINSLYKVAEDFFEESLFPSDVYSKLDNPILTEKQYEKLEKESGLKPEELESLKQWIGVSKLDYLNDLLSSNAIKFNNPDLGYIRTNKFLLDYLGGDISTLEGALAAATLADFDPTYQFEDGTFSISKNHGDLAKALESKINAKTNRTLSNYLKKVYKQIQTSPDSLSAEISDDEGNSTTMEDVLSDMDDNTLKNTMADTGDSVEQQIKKEEAKERLAQYKKLFEERSKDSILYGALNKKLKEIEKTLDGEDITYISFNLPGIVTKHLSSSQDIKDQFDKAMEELPTEVTDAKKSSIVKQIYSDLTDKNNEALRELQKYKKEKDLSDEQFNAFKTALDLDFLQKTRLVDALGFETSNKNRTDKNTDLAYLKRNSEANKEEWLNVFTSKYAELSKEQQEELINNYISSGLPQYKENYYSKGNTDKEDGKLLPAQANLIGLSNAEYELVKFPSESEAKGRIRRAISDNFISNTVVGNSGFMPVELDFLSWAVNNMPTVSKEDIPEHPININFNYIMRDIEQVKEDIMTFSEDRAQKSFDKATYDKLQSQLDAIEKMSKDAEKELDGIDKKIDKLEKRMQDAPEGKAQQSLSEQLTSLKEARVAAFDQSAKNLQALDEAKASLLEATKVIQERLNEQMTAKEKEELDSSDFNFTERKNDPTYGDIVYDAISQKWYKARGDGKGVYVRPLNIEAGMTWTMVKIAFEDVETSSENSTAIKEQQDIESVEDKFVKTTDFTTKSITASDLFADLSVFKQMDPDNFEKLLAGIKQHLTGDLAYLSTFLDNANTSNFKFMEAVDTTNDDLGKEFGHSKYQKAIQAHIIPLLESLPEYSIMQQVLQSEAI